VNWKLQISTPNTSKMVGVTSSEGCSSWRCKRRRRPLRYCVVNSGSVSKLFRLISRYSVTERTVLSEYHIAWWRLSGLYFHTRDTFINRRRNNSLSL